MFYMSCPQYLILSLLGGILTFLFAIWGGGILLGSSSIIKGIRGPKFYEKHSFQILNMVFFALVIYLFLDLLLGTILVKRFKISIGINHIKQVVENLSIVQYFLCGMGISIFLIVILFLFKKILIKSRPIFLFLSVLTSVLLWFFTFIGISLKFLFFYKGVHFIGDLHPLDLLSYKYKFSIFMTLCYLFLSIAIAGSVSAFYLMIRRNKDDYGRDYYKFAIPVSAKWGYSYLVGIIFLVIQTLWVYKEIKTIPIEIFCSIGALILLIGIELFCGIKLIKSQHPIRLKEIIIIKPIVAFIISVAFVFTQMIEVGTFIIK